MGALGRQRRDGGLVYDHHPGRQRSYEADTRVHAGGLRVEGLE